MSRCILARRSIGVEAFTSLWKALCVSFIFFGPFQETTLVPCPPSWAEAQCSEQCTGSGWDCSRSGGSALPVFLLCICLNSLAAGGPVSQMGSSGLGREVHPGYVGFFFPFFVCLDTWKRAVESEVSSWTLWWNRTAGELGTDSFSCCCSLFNYLCSKWMKQLWAQGRGGVQPSWCKYQSAVYGKEK